MEPSKMADFLFSLPLTQPNPLPLERASINRIGASRFRQVEQKAPRRDDGYLFGINLDLGFFIPCDHRTGLQTVFGHCRAQGRYLPFSGVWLGHRLANLDQHARARMVT